MTYPQRIAEVIEIGLPASKMVTLLQTVEPIRRGASRRNQTRTTVGKTCAGVAKITETFPAVAARITAWLEVRVLPGPPNNKINGLDGYSATLASHIGDR